jgi:DNA-binding CsgD family transcriptional regulator
LYDSEQSIQLSRGAPTRVKNKFHGLLSLKGEVLYANQEALELIDAKLEDIVGTPLWETPWHIDEPGQPDTIKEMVRRAAEGDGAQKADMWLSLPTGRMLVEQSVRPILNGEGRTVSLIPGSTPKGVGSLSNREKQVLSWTAKGKTAWETGAILGISKRTVEWHAGKAREKLRAINITHAIFLAVRCGVIGVMGTGICGIGISVALQSPMLRKAMRDISQVMLIVS